MQMVETQRERVVEDEQRSYLPIVHKPILKGMHSINTIFPKKIHVTYFQLKYTIELYLWLCHVLLCYVRFVCGYEGLWPWMLLMQLYYVATDSNII